MKGAVFNVGPLSNVYSGVHTYSDVLFPFIKELKKHDVELTWVGIALQNNLDNPKCIPFHEEYEMNVFGDVEPMNRSWDLLDVTQFDFLLCQPRPLENKIENQILFTLIEKFLDAGKKVFVWEQDLFTANFTQRMKDEVFLLHPAIIKPLGFKNCHYFPFFTYKRTDGRTADSEIEELFEFLFIGNVYSRHEAAVNFFGKLNEAPFRKTVFGDWIKDEERAKFASQFDQFEFLGSTEHWAAIPLMRRAQATLHITPTFASERGLMTARVFTSQMADCLCFCDESIYGAEQFFPKELIVKDGNEIKEKWQWAQDHKFELLQARKELLKEHTVENRVNQFMGILFAGF